MPNLNFRLKQNDISVLRYLLSLPRSEYKTIKEIAEETKLSVNSCRNVLRKLHELKLLDRSGKPRVSSFNHCGGSRFYTYRINDYLYRGGAYRDFKFIIRHKDALTLTTLYSFNFYWNNHSYATDSIKASRSLRYYLRVLNNADRYVERLKSTSKHYRVKNLMLSIYLRWKRFIEFYNQTL